MRSALARIAVGVMLAAIVVSPASAAPSKPKAQIDAYACMGQAVLPDGIGGTYTVDVLYYPFSWRNASPPIWWVTEDVYIGSTVVHSGDVANWPEPQANMTEQRSGLAAIFWGYDPHDLTAAALHFLDGSLNEVKTITLKRPARGWAACGW